jgi:F-type H+-transporting ATPase subunit alpha
VVNQTVQLKPEQISRIIRSQIKYYENAIEQTETGTVTMVGDGIARAAGLDNCMAGELVQFDSGTYGMAQNLEENSVSIVLLGDDSGIKEGGTIRRTGKVVSVPVGDALIGRVVNALGQPIDDKAKSQIAGIKDSIDMKLLVSLSCTMCPELVTAAQRIAADNENVTAEV